jgi:Icc-related predicted phosphoesterase
MIIDCISDLHGSEPEMPGGDLLIVAGDMTGRDEPSQWINFFAWLRAQEYEKKVIIGGNHDNFLQECASTKEIREIGLRWGDECDYLKDSGCEFGGLKIWGSPWTRSFVGMNPECMAFTLRTEDELDYYWDKIPEDTDILVTHSPPAGILDNTSRKYRVGSSSLRKQLEVLHPRLHVFGHIHQGYGKEEHGKTIFVNAAHLNGDYDSANEPIRVIL